MPGTSGTTCDADCGGGDGDDAALLHGVAAVAVDGYDADG